MRTTTLTVVLDDEQLADLKRWNEWATRTAATPRIALQAMFTALANMPEPRWIPQVGDRIRAYEAPGWESVSEEAGEVVVAVDDECVYTAWRNCGLTETDYYTIEDYKFVLFDGVAHGVAQ